MTKRPNYQNKSDACCSCGEMFATPKDHEKPGEGELLVHQPSSSDPPQWICPRCKKRLGDDERRNG